MIKWCFSSNFNVCGVEANQCERNFALVKNVNILQKTQRVPIIEHSFKIIFRTNYLSENPNFADNSPFPSINKLNNHKN